MSNKTQLQTNNTVLDGYITRINAAKEMAASLPEAGSGGGGSVETCTVNFDNESLSSDCPIGLITAMTFENGVYKIYTYVADKDEWNKYYITIPNVVCGSTIILESPLYGGGTYVDIDGSAILESTVHLHFIATNTYAFTFIAPQTANENCTIYYAYDA